MAKSKKQPRQSELRPSELVVPEEEQIRLIRESDLFPNGSRPAESSEDLDTQLTLGDEIFNAITLIIPFTSLFLLMDILVHQQYSQTPTLASELGRLSEGLPFLSFFIFQTNRYRNRRLCQSVLTAISILAGTSLVHLVNKASYLKIMRQTPPIGTIWVYAIWQLDLFPAVLSLIVVYSWVWWRDLKIVF